MNKMAVVSILGLMGWLVLAFQDPSPSSVQDAVIEATASEASEQAYLIRGMNLLPELAAVTVIVRGSTILLGGSVNKPEALATAEALVHATYPNRYLVNKIQVAAETASEESLPTEEGLKASQIRQDLGIQERIETIFRAIPSLQGIEVTVQSGVVQLSGQAILVEDSEKAIELAGKVAGVIFVDNAVEVSQEVNQRLTPVIDNTLQRLRKIWISLPLLLIAILIVGVFVLLGKWATRWERPYRFVEEQPLVKGILQQAIFLVFILIGIIMALDLLNARRLVTTLFGAAGIVGLALGFALKDIVENYLSSLLLAVRRPFTVKDYVQIGDFEGTVVRLNFRDTVLMTADGNHLRLPNAMVFKSVMVNFSRNPLRRFDFDLGVGVNEDLKQVQELGLESLRNTPGVVAEPKAFAMVSALGDSNVIVSFYAWVDQSQSGFAKVKSEAIRNVKETMDRENIEMPAPSYHLDVQQRLEPKVPHHGTGGDRALTERTVDVAPDDALDAQIRKDEAESGEANLLRDRPAKH